MPELFVFKAGKYPQGDWPEERVKKLVDAYDPVNNLEAPAVIGHQAFAVRDADQYAHGWVESMRMDRDGKVYAVVNDFSLEARHAIAEKKLRCISVEIFEFDKINKDDAPYLRAVALLGRDTPAVTGTKIPAMFSSLFSGGVVNTADEENHVSTFSRKLNAEDIKTLSFEGREKTQEESEMAKTAEELQAELEKSNAKIAELEKSASELAAFKKENEELKNAGKKNEAEAYFGKLRDDGKLPPAVFEKAVSFDARLGESERKEFRALFSALEAKVDLSGKHFADKKKAPVAAAGSAALTAKIRAFQKEKKLASFAEAADALFAEKPELFEEEESND
ncbi:MAG: hypothetical protein LBG91_02240 [Treponema sp.]|jgi:hypothetical protein|nr:hypothetical protein [Treponema sp.]